MLTLTDRASIRRAALDARLDRHLRAILHLRFEQMGGSGAHFHALEPGDTLAAAEAAVGWPLASDESPCWEWLAHHPGGWTEVTFVLSDDGPAQVLLVPDGACPALDGLLRYHA